MKSLNLFALAMAFVIASLSSHAQQTYSVTSVPHSARVSGSNLSAFGLTLIGQGNEVNWVSGGSDSSCGTPGGNGQGFIFVTFNGQELACMNAVSYTVSGTVTVPTPPFGSCSGSAHGVMVFTEPNGSEGKLTVSFTYYRARYGCYGEIVGGTLTF